VTADDAEAVSVALRALRRLPTGRRTPERIIEALEGVGLQVRAAPNASRAGNEGPAAPVVECGSCGRVGRLVADRGGSVRVAHAPVVCVFAESPSLDRGVPW
jgi:hypothetical protein